MVPVGTEHQGKVFVIPSGRNGAATASALMKKVGISPDRIAKALVPFGEGSSFRIQLDRLNREQRDRLLSELHRSPLVDVGDMPSITSMEVASYFVRLLEARWKAKQDPGHREGKPEEIEKEFRMRIDRVRNDTEMRFLEQAFSLCLKMVEESQPEYDRIKGRILELEQGHGGKGAEIEERHKENVAVQKTKKSRYTWGAIAAGLASLGIGVPNINAIFKWLLVRVELIPFVKDAEAVTGGVIAALFGLANGYLWVRTRMANKKIIILDRENEKESKDYETAHHSEVDRKWEEHGKFRDGQATRLQLAVIEAMMTDYPIFIKDDLAMRGFPGIYDLDLGRNVDREQVLGIYRVLLENSSSKGTV